MVCVVLATFSMCWYPSTSSRPKFGIAQVAPWPPHSGWGTGTPNQTIGQNAVWDFAYHSPNTTGHSVHSLVVYSNADEWGGYTDIPRKLDDPSDWALTNDFSAFHVANDIYAVTTHPGRIWQVGGIVGGRKGFGRPRGVNTGTVDGSVTWTPNDECMLGYPPCGGGTADITCRNLQAPRPGRPGYLP